jgi:hypothetical protein
MTHVQSDSADLDFRDHVIGGDDAALMAAREARLRKAAHFLVLIIGGIGVVDKMGFDSRLKADFQGRIDAVKKELA